MSDAREELMNRVWDAYWEGEGHTKEALERVVEVVLADQEERYAELRRALEGLVDCHAKFTGEPGHDASVWAEADDVARAALSKATEPSNV